MWESLKMGFYQTFILEDNYQYFVKGLGTTLTVTVFALVIGVIIGVLVAIIRSAYDQQPERKKGLLLKIQMCIRDRYCWQRWAMKSQPLITRKTC